MFNKVSPGKKRNKWNLVVTPSYFDKLLWGGEAAHAERQKDPAPGVAAFGRVLTELFADLTVDLIPETNKLINKTYCSSKTHNIHHNLLISFTVLGGQFGPPSHKEFNALIWVKKPADFSKLESTLKSFFMTTDLSSHDGASLKLYTDCHQYISLCFTEVEL